MSDDFDGTYARIGTFTVVTPGGGTVTVAIEGIENLTFPPGSNKEDKYVPISGTRSGYEQVVICSKEAGDITARLTYELSHHLAMEAIRGINGCTITLSLDDGLTLVARGGIKKLAVAQIEDSKHVTDDIALAVDANWVLSDTGDTVTRVGPFLVTMTSGTATIDLTNADGVNLTGKKITKLSVSAKSTNANAITVETGDTNGYEPISGYSQVLLASEVSVIDPLNAPTVGGSAYTLDVSGTQAQAVYVYIEAVTP
jgi:hypothetical protein